ncbi:MAG: hypothetical protein Q8R17_01885 [bacterium]|nr:hypothetical protein [bacterium]
MKDSKPTLIVIGVLVVVVGIALVAVKVFSGPSTADPEVLSRTGLHWHPELTIFVKEERQGIPANIGISAVHNPVHTHDATGVIHLEMQGLVKKSNTKLGVFFRVWNKTFADFGTTTPRMTVNGVENIELLDYPMKDKDKIELYFE